ncbi:MAG: galactosyldiacylglycerol synthase [Bryobacteraceae bacterium]
MISSSGSSPTRIDLFYVEAGGGHKSAATALKTVIESQGKPWDVRLVNLDHVLGTIDVFRKASGYGVEDIYNLLLKKGWTAAAPYLMPVMHLFIWLLRPIQVRMLAAFFRKDPPRLVVSLIPHFNRSLCQAVARSVRSPFVTILTDFADIPPRVWLERQEQFVICGTEKAVEQARSYGLAPERVFRVSGMILRPSFYDVPPIDRAAERQALGLETDRATALVLFGGEGSRAMIDIARRLGDSGLPLQLILMYGRNEKIGAALRELRLPVPAHVQGFTRDVPRFMQMSDFLIGKPGPGSITEALAMRLPVVVDKNRSTLPQERYNADWLVENRLGMVVREWDDVAPAVRELLAPGVLDDYRTRAAQIENRAVFEIVEILERILG